MKKVIFLLLIALTVSAQGQTNKEKAYEFGKKAIKEMDDGNIKEAIKLLEESIKLDPEDINYSYEIAYAQYLDKNYKGASKTLKGL